MDERMHSL